MPSEWVHSLGGISWHTRAPFSRSSVHLHLPPIPYNGHCLFRACFSLIFIPARTVLWRAPAARHWGATGQSSIMATAPCHSTEAVTAMRLFSSGLFLEQSYTVMHEAGSNHTPPLPNLSEGRKTNTCRGTRTFSPYLRGLVDVPAYDVSDVAVLLGLEVHSGRGLFL